MGRRKEPLDGERLVPVQIKVPESKREAWHEVAAAQRTTLTELITGLMDGEVLPTGTDLPTDEAFREALERIRARLLQADDGPAIRYCVLAVDRLLQTDEGRSLLFGEVIGEATAGGEPKKKR